MAYEPTVLIARRGYGSMGDASSCSSNQEWDANCTFNGIKGQCVPIGTAGKNAACSYSSGGSGIWDTIKSIAGSVADIYGKSKTPAQPQVIVQGSSTPSWVLPAVVGGGVLAVVMLTRKRSNPARRRRRRR